MENTINAITDILKEAEAPDNNLSHKISNYLLARIIFELQNLARVIKEHK